MSLSNFAVNRPVFTTMVTLIVLLLGGIAFNRLPIDLMPDITYPTLTVATSYPNVSPEEMETLITRPLEAAVAAVPGVEEFTSISAEGQSQIRITFTWGTDLDAAANDVRDRLDRVNFQLEDVRPQLRKFDAAAFPIVILGVSANLDPIDLRTIVDEQIQVRLEQVPGVASADVWGGLSREIHIELEKDKIRALGLSIDQVQAQLRAQNVVRPAGQIERDNREIRVRTLGDFRDLDELRRTVVAGHGAETVYLGDIATVEDRWERERQRVRINGEPGVRLGVRKQAGTNTVEVAKAAIAAAEQLNRELPQIRIATVIDTSEYIERSINNIARTVVIGGLLALIVLTVFLRNIRTTLVIAVSIPVAIIASFALLYFNGYTLNIMTLGGLALGIGMLLDNSIVVLENIFRRREAGEEPKTAAVRGANEVSSAIVASTLTTLAVFLPMIFVQGISGVMFIQMAAVVAFALTCSLLAALTLVPMLAARIPAKRSSATKGWRGLDTSWMAKPAAPRRPSTVEATYLAVLDWALKRPYTTMGLAALLFAGSLLLVPLLGSEFMPQADEGEVRVNIELEVGAKLDRVDETLAEIEHIVLNDIPEVENVIMQAGGGGWRISGGNTGNLRISLVPASQRSRSSAEVAADVRRRVAHIPGATIRIRAGGGFFLLRMGSGGDDSLTIEIRGHDLDRAAALAERVRDIAEAVPGVTDAALSREAGYPEEIVYIDRDRAQSMAVSVENVARLLETVIGGTRVGFFRDGGTQVPIRLRVYESERLTVDELLDLTVQNRYGESVTLRNVVNVAPADGPSQIDRKDQQRIVTVSANVEGRDLGTVAAELQTALYEIPMPQGFVLGVAGDYEQQQESFRELTVAIGLAIVLVFMVLACQFESLRHPAIVMATVPFAAIGVFLTLFLTDTTLNVQSLIGCMMLAGIVVNNAILLVNQGKQLLSPDTVHEMDKRLWTVRDAVREAGRRRLRPILMTTLTTAFGLLPLAIGMGEGGEAQAPMARAVVGGLLSSMLIVLVLIPVIFERLIKIQPNENA